MKHLKKFNEGIFDDISRLNPKRLDSDNKFVDLTKDIIDDFEKNGKDLRKIKILDNEGNKKISLSRIEIGKYYNLSYVFGSFHSTYRNIGTANRKNWDRRIEISKIPFTLTLKKNELERAFRTDRVKFAYCRVKEINTTPNYDRNPNIGNYRVHNEKEDEYRVSSDVANNLFKYFIDEFNIQYPDLKDGKYKGINQISDIEKGISPVLNYITVYSKYGDELIYNIRKGDNEDEIRKKLYNMTKAEYDAYCKEQNNKLYTPSRIKSEENINLKKSQFIKDIIEPLNLNYYRADYDTKDYELRIYNESIKWEFKTVDTNIETKLKNLPNKYKDFKLEIKNISKPFESKFSESVENLKFVTIIYEIP